MGLHCCHACSAPTHVTHNVLPCLQCKPSFIYCMVWEFANLLIEGAACTASLPPPEISRWRSRNNAFGPPPLPCLQWQPSSIYSMLWEPADLLIEGGACATRLHPPERSCWRSRNSTFRLHRCHACSVPKHLNVVLLFGGIPISGSFSRQAPGVARNFLLAQQEQLPCLQCIPALKQLYSCKNT